MKAEERHQLKENDLSSWLQYGLPIFLRQNGSYFLLLLAFCFLGYQLYNMYERKQENARVAAWNEFHAAFGSENPAGKLQEAIDNTDIKELRSQAYLALGQYNTQLLLSPDRLNELHVTRSEVIQKASEAYQKALEIYGQDNLIAGKAELGLAGVLEDRGDWAGARKEYEKLVDKQGQFADTPFAEVGALRLAGLEARQNAPRLVAMMPPTATRRAALPPSLGAFGPEAPTGATGGPSTAPAPFNAPEIPGISPLMIPTPPSTMPATVPAP